MMDKSSIPVISVPTDIEIFKFEGVFDQNRLRGS